MQLFVKLTVLLYKHTIEDATKLSKELNCFRNLWLSWGLGMATMIYFSQMNEYHYQYNIIEPTQLVSRREYPVVLEQYLESIFCWYLEWCHIDSWVYIIYPSGIKKCILENLYPTDTRPVSSQCSKRMWYPDENDWRELLRKADKAYTRVCSPLWMWPTI